jgi:DNA-binding beta-propeller fold protein YncE
MACMNQKFFACSLALTGLFMPAAVVKGAVIEVTAGGRVTEPTYQFSDHSGGHLANLTANSDGDIAASGDLKTGTGSSLDALALLSANVQFFLGPTINTLRWRAGPVTTLAGSDTAAFADGTGNSARFNDARGMDFSSDGTLLFVADAYNHRIRQVVIATGVVTTLAGSGTATFADGTGNAASFSYPYGLAVSVDGTLLFVTDTGNNRIRQVVIATGVVTTLAGSGTATFADGTGSAASFWNAQDIAISPDGTRLFVADGINARIRQVVVATGVVTTLAGSGADAFADGTGNAASFYRPRDVAVTPDGTLLFVADEYNHRIR